MTLKFKVDDNLPTEAAALLNEAGHDALTNGKLWIVDETTIRIRN